MSLPLPSQSGGQTPGCNCASHGLIDGTRHGLACPYGLAKLREYEESKLKDELDAISGELPEAPQAWGQKWVVYVYVEGAGEGVTGRLIEAVNGAVPEAEFIGMETVPVPVKPTDQGAS